MKTVFKVLLLVVHIFCLKATSFSPEEIQGLVAEHKTRMESLYPSPENQRFHEGYKFALYVSQSSEETFTKEAKTNIVRAVLFRGTGYGGVSKTVLVTDIERKAAILALSTVGLLEEVYGISYAHDPLTDAHVREAARYFEMGQRLAQELKAAHEKAEQERQEEEAKAKAEEPEPEGIQTSLQEFMEGVTTHEPFEAIKCLKDYGYKELRKGTFSIEVSKLMGSEVNAKAPLAETPSKSTLLPQIRSPNPVNSSTPSSSPFAGLFAGIMGFPNKERDMFQEAKSPVSVSHRVPHLGIVAKAIQTATPGSATKTPKIGETYEKLVPRRLSFSAPSNGGASPSRISEVSLPETPKDPEDTDNQEQAKDNEREDNNSFPVP
jgi:hypothetical protein